MKLHLCCTSLCPISFCLPLGTFNDIPKRRNLIKSIYYKNDNYFLMCKAYEADKASALAKSRGFCIVVPPKKDRKSPWVYDKQLYKQRNNIEGYFIKLRCFRKVFLVLINLILFLFLSSLSLLFSACFLCKRYLKL